MFQITVKVEGMECGMCEAHVNDAIRGAFRVKKVTSSHSRGETVILSQEDIEEEKLKEVINRTGYTAGAITKGPYEKKGFFASLRK